MIKGKQDILFLTKDLESVLAAVCKGNEEKDPLILAKETSDACEQDSFWGEHKGSDMLIIFF